MGIIRVQGRSHEMQFDGTSLPHYEIVTSVRVSEGVQASQLPVSQSVRPYHRGCMLCQCRHYQRRRSCHYYL